MGGFTELKLKDSSKENIAKHNKMLDEAKVKKGIRFYSEDDVLLEYESFMNYEGVFPAHLFPRDKIKNYQDFTKYWSTEALGATFCPPFGTLTFDCYFNRTTANAMKCIKNYIINALLLQEYFMKSPFEYASGSWSTFLERCSVSKLGLELINEKIKDK
jgi:hypothetical protein